MDIEDLLRSPKPPIDDIPFVFKVMSAKLLIDLSDKSIVNAYREILMELACRVSKWDQSNSYFHLSDDDLIVLPSDEIICHGIDRVLNLSKESLVKRMNPDG